MSIIVTSSQHGFVLCHETAINKSVQHSCNASNTLTDICDTYKSNPDFFDISEPFLYDSQFNKVMAEQSTSNGQSTSNEQSTVRKRKRKRKQPLNQGEAEAITFHQQHIDTLRRALRDLVTLSRAHDGRFTLQNSDAERNNNIKARNAAQNLHTPDYFHLPLAMQQTSAQHITQYIDNNGEVYILPANSSYLNSDITQLHLLEDYARDIGGFNLIVLDPPWQNKVIKRRKMDGYAMLHDAEFSHHIHIPRLAKPGCLVTVWVTTNQRQHRVVKEIMFPAWDVQFLTMWFWVKVTKHGDPIASLDSTFKRPYECIMIGRYKGTNQSLDPESCDMTNSTNQSPTCESLDRAIPANVSSDYVSHCTDISANHSPVQGSHDTEVPTNQVLVSVPCSLHSRKPPLDVLRRYLPPDGVCLEMFARNLLPGWTSWGNQVLKFQHQSYFQTT